MVGDPKQSIYPFTHADISLARQLQQVVGKESLGLVQNFRSQRPIITWVNHVFGQWMQESDGQPAYAALEWRWDGSDTKALNAPNVHRFGQALPSKTAEVRRAEAEALAGLLRGIPETGWAVADGEDDGGQVRFRPARYDDVCVLVPNRTGLLRHLEIALEEAGVPYRLESASLVLDTQEVRDLLVCLEAVDNPVDQVAVVAALRSPAFACSDVELLSFLEAGGRLDYLAYGPQAPEGAVLVGLRSLASYQDASRETPFPLLIERFIRERRLMELALDYPRPREQWRRYQFLIDRARAFAEAGGSSLRQFLQWMRQQQAEGARSVETPVPEGDEEAVRVMTVHGSKGLEFPIVVMADLGGRVNGQSPHVLFDRVTGSVEVRLGQFQTAGYSAVQTLEAEREREQFIRLMYVAATRAKDHLVVSCYRPDGARHHAPAATIQGFMEDAGDLWQPLAPVVVAPAPPVPSVSALANDTAAAREAWIQERAGLLRARARPAAVAATALAHEEREDRETEAEPWRRGRAGTSVGRAVHAVLQSVDLATGTGLEETARAQAQAEGIPQRVGEAVTLARRALESQAVRRAVASGRWWREVPVGVPVGDGVLEGFIDLLFEEDGGLVVVDYKTDAVPNEAAVREAMERYRLQGGAYALAVQRVTGRPVREVIFVFLQPQIEEPVKDLDALVADAGAAAEAYLAGLQ